MRIDLLWFRHTRPPRPHVAEPKGYSVDMSEMILDLSESPLARMARTLAGQWVTRDEETQVGQYFQHEGKWRKALRVERVEPSDWFAPTQWRVCIEEPVRFGAPGRGVKVQWLEDEMFPRLRGAA